MERRHGQPCWLTKLREADPALAEQAQRGLDSPYNAESVADWLTKHGVAVKGQTIRTHRAGRCGSCQTTS